MTTRELNENTIFLSGYELLLIFWDKFPGPYFELLKEWNSGIPLTLMTMRKLENSELNRLNIQEFKDAPKIPLVIVLDNIRSLNNVGSVFRTSDAFLIDKIYLCGITATPPHKDIRKTALGATESVDWEYRDDTLELIKELKKSHCCLAVEQAEKANFLNELELQPETAYALVFGHEVKGVSQEVVDECQGVLEIPQFGTKHSINVSVSAGIVIWEFWKKLQK